MPLPPTPFPEELNVLFFYLVVRRSSLQSFDGGEPAFFEHFPTSKQTSAICAWCAMSGQDIEPIREKLISQGLTEDDYCIGIWDGLSCHPDSEEETVQLCSWLIGRIQGGNMWVRPSHQNSTT